MDKLAFNKISSLIFLLLLLDSLALEHLDDLDDQEIDPEVAYNLTYTEQMTKLDADLFGVYSRDRRPVKNENKPVEVKVHYHVIHLAVDEEEGVLWLHGHLYMTWSDEFLGWDSTKYNGVRMTRTRKWNIWNPTLRIHNTVSGAQSNWEISRSSHVIITSRGESFAQIEVYPTMSLKVGCHFDFTDFPDDEQRCSVRMFANERMPEVQLKFYGELPSTVLLGWGSQSMKKKVGSWELIDTKNTVEYYSAGNYSTEVPVLVEKISRTWTILETTFILRRHAPLFTYCFKLPCLVSTLLAILPFFLPNIHHSIVILVTNIVIQVVFMHELVMKTPLAIGSLPNTVLFYGLSLGWNGLCLGFHVACLWAPRATPGMPILNPLALFSPEKSSNNEEDSLPALLSAFRTIIGIFSLFLFASFYLFLVVL
ncbi:unnamed protein product, partial [Mesorhabditis belari]|uniref:Neurotransmitter-gated ion-channel ligand-binding domain-containing protein n=1 Tax=Mesorhabditis belari TaxID=2138241 RepID=A0AAF3E967_9BILA